MKKRILIVVTSWDKLGSSGRSTGLWLEEFTAPYYAFLDGGLKVTVVSPKGGKVPVDPESLKENASTETTKRFLESGDKILEHTEPLEYVRSDDFDAVFYPGGHGPMWDLATDLRNAALLSEMFDSGKIIGAVCHGPAALVMAVGKDSRSILAGRKVTGFSNTEEEAVKLEKIVPFLLESRLKELGADYSKADNWTVCVKQDGNLVTGQNPQSAKGVADAVLALLNG